MAKARIASARHCLQCGIGPIGRIKFCSTTCYNVSLNARRRADPVFQEGNLRRHREFIERRYGPVPEGRTKRFRLAPHPCEACGEPTQKPRFCSAKCGRKSDAVRACMRAASHVRRSKVKGVEFERFDPVDVLRRDDWTCYICGVHTPENLRGTFDQLAPEIDHIVPVSRGGTHTWSNVACCCRKCNGLKRAKMPSEFFAENGMTCRAVSSL